jgi:CHAT domain-containing protein
MSDLEFANFLASGLAEDFAVSFRGKKYPATNLLPLQATLLEQAQTGSTDGAKAFTDFTKTAMEQTLAMGLTETCALLGDGGLAAIMDFADRGQIQGRDYFFLVSLLLIQAEFENENFHYAARIAARLRMEVRLWLEAKRVADPLAAKAWDLHLKYLIGSFTLPDDEILQGREKIGVLLGLKTPNPNKELRIVLKRLNALESAKIELYRYNWKGAEKLLRPLAKDGDRLAQAWLAKCLMFLDKYREAGDLLGQLLPNNNFRQPDFQAYMNAGLALALWQSAAKDHQKAIETLEDCRMQVVTRRKIDQAVSGKELPDYIKMPFYYIYRQETASLAVLGEKDKAAAAAMHYSTIIRVWANQVLLGTSESEQLRFKELMEDGPFTVPHMAKQTRLLADNLVFFKGLVADELGKNPISSRKIEALLIQGYDSDLARDAARLAEEGAEREDLKFFDWANLKDSLPEGLVFVDFVRCGGRLNERGGTEPVYLAVITSRETNEEPVLLDLGPAVEIENKITTFLATMRLGFDDPNSEALAKDLHALLINPILNTISPATKGLIFSPDGHISFLNLAALPDGEGIFLCEKFPSYYASSARDVISTNPKQAFSKSVPLIFANPSFGAPSHPDGARTRSFSLQPLPQAEKEAETVAVSLRERGLSPKVFAGEAATEKAFRSTSAPPVIHFATHGFFLGDKAIKNPMRAGGLALAGSAKFADRAKRGLCDDDADDGILTAEEISRMNLRGTWLVSVSACESGMGRTLNGEGLLGLQRGFQNAGAQNLLLCLWPIEDSAARNFIETFYREISKGRDPQTAYHYATTRLLTDLRKVSGISSAIRNAGAFVLSSGQPEVADTPQRTVSKRLVKAEKR